MLDEIYWMTRTNDINFDPTFFQHLPKISSNMLDKIMDRFGQNVIDKFSKLSKNRRFCEMF